MADAEVRAEEERNRIRDQMAREKALEKLKMMGSSEYTGEESSYTESG